PDSRPRRRPDRRARHARGARPAQRPVRGAPSQTAVGRGARGVMSGVHEEEVLGKAYDARLMRRLLTYLTPYWRQVIVALIAILGGSGAALAQPYLTKVAIDRYIAAGRLEGLNALAGVYFGILLFAFAAEYLQTWMMQMTGQQIMFDLRMAIY